jgi:catechol 2,3-dioxygenase-like lactoylglutathione lyase family enzyme
MPIAGLRFGHVAFKVSDAERSVRWYADALAQRRFTTPERRANGPS